MLGPEDPAHEVILDAYYIDLYEVTNADYKKYLDATGSNNTPRYWDDSNFNQPNQPVVGITWKEAQAFCRMAKQTPAYGSRMGKGRTRQTSGQVSLGQ